MIKIIVKGESHSTIAINFKLNELPDNILIILMTLAALCARPYANAFAMETREREGRRVRSASWLS